jgi:hypothetical protein
VKDLTKFVNLNCVEMIPFNQRNCPDLHMENIFLVELVLYV